MSTAVSQRISVISSSTQLTHDEIGEIVDASGRSVSRWSTGAAEPQRISRQRLLELAYVAEELQSVLKAEDANLWIHSPNRLLDGDTPAQRIQVGDFRSVVGLIEALADGIVV
ncbi:MAG: antitoxin Xre/MbcA/ParS toxin-binding domain-containing protein [Acidimicrobiia bacterium]